MTYLDGKTNSHLPSARMSVFVDCVCDLVFVTAMLFES